MLFGFESDRLSSEDKWWDYQCPLLFSLRVWTQEKEILLRCFSGTILSHLPKAQRCIEGAGVPSLFKRKHVDRST